MPAAAAAAAAAAADMALLVSVASPHNSICNSTFVTLLLILWLLTCWNSCDTTDWNRSTTRGLGGGGPWLAVITGCLLLELISILQAQNNKPEQQHPA
jgi:hypothetical protein